MGVQTGFCKGGRIKVELSASVCPLRELLLKCNTIFFQIKKKQSSQSIVHFVKISSSYTICIRELDVFTQAGFGAARGTSFNFSYWF